MVNCLHTFSFRSLLRDAFRVGADRVMNLAKRERGLRPKDALARNVSAICWCFCCWSKEEALHRISTLIETLKGIFV